MKINIISETNRRIPRKKIAGLMSLMEEEDPPDSNLNLIFTRNARMARLNKEYRGKSKPTDVLSFRIDSESGPDFVFGEIYISTDMAQENLKLFGGTITSELIRLCCHGFLHLLGYDHASESGRIKMKKREEYYLEKLKQC